jgi:hypothetical protein
MNASPWEWLATYGWMLPSLIVWTVGLIVAIGRWGRHPQVSALLAASLATMIAAILAYRFGMAIILQTQGSAGPRAMGLYLGVLQLAMAGVRAACYAAMIAAVFGWRRTADGTYPTAWQFSIRGLIGLTLAVAVLCALGRAAAGWLGEVGPQLMQFVDDIPVYACLAIGMWLATTRSARHPQVSQLAFIGLGLSIATSVVGQTIWSIIVPWSISRSLIPLVSLALSIFASLAWVLILCAALGWRTLDSPFASHPAKPEI